MAGSVRDTPLQHRCSRGMVLAAQCFGVLAVVGFLSGLAAYVRSTVLIALAASAVAAVLAAAGWFGRKLLRWNVRLWIGSYLRQERFRIHPAEPLDLCFIFVDHFEPNHGRSDSQRQLQRVQSWEVAYQQAILGHTDSDGRCPQHTWFFPGMDPAEEAASMVSTWPRKGWGEIEYHLHHEEKPDLTGRELRDRLAMDLERLQRCGAVTSARYAFVHGMYALAGGDPRYCRAVDELEALRDTGCYADFTFPDLETPAQPAQVNSIYYARTTGRPKPYDRGVEATVGVRCEGLMMIPGPMYLGLFPRMLDDGDLDPTCLPHEGRIPRWLDAHVHVRGWPNCVFVVVHSHTALEQVQQALFQGAMQRLWIALERTFKRPGARLHYLTAREAYNVIKAAEANHRGDPNDYRDFEIPPPANRRGASGPIGAHRQAMAPAEEARPVSCD